MPNFFFPLLVKKKKNFELGSYIRWQLDVLDLECSPHSSTKNQQKWQEEVEGSQRLLRRVGVPVRWASSQAAAMAPPSFSPSDIYTQTKLFGVSLHHPWRPVPARKKMRALFFSLFISGDKNRTY